MSNIQTAISQVRSQMNWDIIFTALGISKKFDIPLAGDDVVFCDIETMTVVFVTNKDYD
ncbi:MAG TPA: hypothetical protein VE944_19405 [Nostoc sp.]|uniref:hypothetical protein n=1 Tax=Nostoc sp. TaxID=1180 RepID=UPI002D61B1EC|nr:hypothetical protein [Nostoc sp.]HYX16490.1 hypothetical protein [Nostoc sp.]